MTLEDGNVKKTGGGCRRGCGCLLIVMFFSFLLLALLSWFVFRELRNAVSPFMEGTARTTQPAPLSAEKQERLNNKIAKLSGQLMTASCWTFPKEDEQIPQQPMLRDLNNPELVSLTSEEATTLVNNLLRDSAFKTALEITFEGNRTEIKGSVTTFSSFLNFNSKAQLFYTNGQWFFLPDNLTLANEDLLKKEEFKSVSLQKIMQDFHFNADIRSRMSHFCPNQVFVDEGMMYFDLREPIPAGGTGANSREPAPHE